MPSPEGKDCLPNCMDNSNTYLQKGKRKMIVKHVRKNNGTPVATLVAEKTNSNEIAIGWSLCNKKDNFNKHVGINVAIDRLKLTDTDNSSIPHVIKKNVGTFAGRAMRYFRSNSIKVAGKVN